MKYRNQGLSSWADLPKWCSPNGSQSLGPDRNPKRVWFGYLGAGNSGICWFMEQQTEYLKLGQHPAVQDMQTPKPRPRHLLLLKTWRHLGKSHILEKSWFLQSSLSIKGQTVFSSSDLIPQRCWKHELFDWKPSPTLNDVPLSLPVSATLLSHVPYIHRTDKILRR